MCLSPPPTATRWRRSASPWTGETALAVGACTVEAVPHGGFHLRLVVTLRFDDRRLCAGIEDRSA
jgi:hypothetical protein